MARGQTIGKHDKASLLTLQATLKELAGQFDHLLVTMDLAGLPFVVVKNEDSKDRAVTSIREFLRHAGLYIQEEQRRRLEATTEPDKKSRRTRHK